MNDRAWSRVYDFFYKVKDEAVQQRTRTPGLYILTRKEYKVKIQIAYANGKHSLLKCGYDEFISYFKTIWLINVDEVKWTNSKCNWSFFLKNDYCHHFRPLQSA